MENAEPREELDSQNDAPEMDTVQSILPISGKEEESDEGGLVFEERFDDEGELSEFANVDTRNEVDVKGSGNASIVGSNIIIGGNEEDDTVYPCPNCLTEIDASKYGKIICPKCEFKIFRRNLKLDITRFETIEDKAVESNYLNVIARINNNYIKKRYNEAFKHCVKAEELAPREPTTWVYFSLVEFYHEMSQPKEYRKDINEILRISRDNIKVCEANSVGSEQIEEIKSEIGIYLFNLAKSKIGSIYSSSKKQKGYWSKEGRHLTIQYLKLFEDCFRLTKDVFYLKGYVDELSKPYKWIVKRHQSDELLNLPACGKKFNAVGQRERVIKLIEKIEPTYQAPELATERIIISPFGIRISFE